MCFTCFSHIFFRIVMCQLQTWWLVMDMIIVYISYLSSMEHVIFAPIFPIFLWPQCHPWAIRHGPRLSRHWLQRSWWPLCRSSWGATAWSGTPGSGDDPDAGKTMPFLPPMTGNGLLYVYIYIYILYIYHLWWNWGWFMIILPTVKS